MIPPSRLITLTLNLHSTELPQFHTSKYSLYSSAYFIDRTYDHTRYITIMMFKGKFWEMEGGNYWALSCGGRRNNYFYFHAKKKSHIYFENFITISVYKIDRPYNSHVSLWIPAILLSVHRQKSMET